MADTATDPTIDLDQLFDAPDPEGRSTEDRTCPDCGESFASRSGLRRHRTRKHDGVPHPRSSAAPGAGTRPKAARPRAAKGPSGYPDAELRQAAEAWVITTYGLGGAVIAQTLDPVCGGAVAGVAGPEMVDAWYQLGRRNKYVAQMMMATGQVGVFAALVKAHAPIGEAIWAHHLAARPEGEHYAEGFGPPADEVNYSDAFGAS
jgi:hypothetical protein